MKQKTEITIEEQETVVVRQSGNHRSEFCPRCDETVQLVTPEILAALTGASEREIFRLLEEGAIHFVETNRLYACPDCCQRVIIESTLSEKAPGPRGELQGEREKEITK